MNKERINIDDDRNIERVKMSGKDTLDGKHIVVGKDRVTGETLYQRKETGNLEYIGRNGNWVEA